MLWIERLIRIHIIEEIIERYTTYYSLDDLPYVIQIDIMICITGI